MKKVLAGVFEKVAPRFRNIQTIDRLPPVIANFLLVYEAQRVLDDAGYRCFFGANWLRTPPYSRFVDAYAAIGCLKQAKELERISRSFPFENPHLSEIQRSEYMRANLDEISLEIKGWGESLRGDEEVWVKLGEYYRSHQRDFEN
jgi:hypothetical protein